MDTLRLVFALGLAFVALAALLQLVWGYLSMPSLADVPATTPVASALPKVSVIIAARDEERHIESAAAALLAQSYANCELIVVDDRSSDRTSEILGRLARRSPRLHVLTLRELPPGWLGKNHALHVGAAIASGELLLFADADVILRPDTLSRAVRLLRIERADHLAVAPDLVLPSWLLALVVNYFMMWFLLWLRPWQARDPLSSAYVGIGAFNLVRTKAYRSIGGHSRIRLRPDDDLMLGKLLKAAGHRQIVAAGAGAISVEWYRTLGELARGFRKNAFAALRYNMLLTIGAIAGNLALGVWPFAAIWLTSGTERALYLTAVLAQMAGYVGPALMQRTRPWLAVLYPLATLIFVSILGAAVLRTVRRRGIEWRGTFYPLDELRANRI
jgi:cellulose synthase/poly-beta-1,6-N-acetylglucosamine synthase-like glycosyltransferase